MQRPTPTKSFSFPKPLVDKHEMNPAGIRLFIRQGVESKVKGQTQQYQELVGRLVITFNTCKNEEVQHWLRGLTEVCSVLNVAQHDDLVGVCLSSFPWWHASSETCNLYGAFLLNLLTAQPAFIAPCVHALIKTFCPRKSSAADANFEMTNSDEEVFVAVHNTLGNVLRLIPASITTIFPALRLLFPLYYRNEGHTMVTFLQNCLTLIRHWPSLKEHVLDLCVSKLLELDVAIKLEDVPDEDEEEHFVFEIEDDKLNFRSKAENETRMMTTFANILDALMLQMFKYIEEVCTSSPPPDSSIDPADELFAIMLRIFEKTILPTHKSKYTQFLVFYITSVKPDTYPQQFLQLLISKLFDTGINPVIRQTCAGYIGSYLSRAKFLGGAPPSSDSNSDNISTTTNNNNNNNDYNLETAEATLKTALSALVHYAHNYLARMTSSGTSSSSSPFPTHMYNRAVPDASMHAVFYTICQAAFYVMCFHQDFLFDFNSNSDSVTNNNNNNNSRNGTGPSYFQQLNIEPLLTCSLNPLKFCLPTVVNEFTNICTQMGLRTCAEVVIRNQSITLPTRSVYGTSNIIDTFFPFDPYLLRDSAVFLTDQYRSWSPKRPSTSDDAQGDESESEYDTDQPSQNTDEEYISDATNSFKSMSLTPVHHFDMRLDILKNSLEV